MEMLYPMTFVPVHTAQPWAGALLPRYIAAGGAGVSEPPPVGTAIRWELADCAEAATRIANGPFAGTPFGELVRRFPHNLVGRRHPAGASFPVCIRLLDVGDTMPLTVRPAQALSSAAKTWLPSTIFWFSLAATARARIVAGISQGVTGPQVVENVNSPDIERLLQVFRPKAGDSFFVPNRRVHGLGAGNLVWELQENPSPALTVSTWGQAPMPAPDEQDLAIQSIFFQDRQVARISLETGKVMHTRKIPLLHYCPQFMVDEVRLRDHIFDRTTGATFHVIALVRGVVEIQAEGANVTLRQGGVACIPAALGDYRVYVRGDEATLLRITMQPVT